VGFTNEQITDCLLTSCHRAEETLSALLAKANGRRPTVAVLPEGPITIPYVSPATPPSP
jgi:hypothetical protein